MTATAAAAAIRAGTLTSEALVRGCIERIAETEPRVQAWTFFDPQLALQQAREADRRQAAGEFLGPLHGVPVGVKDIFDTADMPTENGTVLHAGRQPARDATAVALLRQAGAVILGKTVTAELAVYSPGKTTNPHDPARTPGGSSSGSAAAVAAGMVPLAIGTQTNGSVIRPASYCGVVGFKPSHGAISRHGVLKQSPALDQVGVFARTVEDAALVSRVLFGHDPADPDTRPQEVLPETPAWEGAAPRIAFVKSPVWDQASETTKRAFSALARQWGDFVQEVELPAAFGSAAGWHRTIMLSDMANHYEPEYANKERLSAALVDMIEQGQRCTGVQYSKARDGMALLDRLLADLFTGFDAILTPATQGAAPVGLASTGSPMFCTIWSLCGVPAITLPILAGEEGMPLGAQLVAARGRDAHLLRVADWLARRAPVAGKAAA
jgi:Asp-tRNA(Asn)/Glu-tRNA(Gln) amidotransferase A subunit family amidase